jgi:hypothetical protein
MLHIDCPKNGKKKPVKKIEVVVGSKYTKLKLVLPKSESRELRDIVENYF